MTPSNNDRGFTLIEVLVAVVILTVALVSMAELMAVTLRLQQLGRNQTTATRLAQDKIDELMSQNWASRAATYGGRQSHGGCREPFRYAADVRWLDRPQLQTTLGGRERPG